MTQTVFDAAAVRERAARMRLDIIEMISAAGSGHPGGSLSSTDIVATLYFGGVLRHDPSRPDWPERDRFVLSKGHAGPVQYAALAEAGYLPREELLTLRKLGSRLQGHPDRLKLPGVEVSTGSLGQGISIACGMAAGFAGTGRDVYCLMGDGEMQEGLVWEAAMFAAHYRLGNLVGIVDENGLQIDGACSDVMCLGSVASKFAAFGWHVIQVDGHDVEAVHDALIAARDHREGPAVIVAKTVKGKGVSFMEGDAGWHGKAPNADETARALAELTAAMEGSAS